jgi:urease accessory protein
MISRVSIGTASRECKTYLKNSFADTPFKVANVTEDKKERSLKLMLMTSSPGILDGDDYRIDILLGEGSSVQLQTQSYQRLFNMKKGAAQRMDVIMHRGTSFTYLPHPTVPHKGADFGAINKIFLDSHCKLIWGEILSCGRKLTGEAFEFKRYQNLTEIFLNGNLVVKENILIEPSINDVNVIGQWEGYTHQASLIYLDESAALEEVNVEIKKILSNLDGVCFGVSALPVKGLILRILGAKAEQMYACLQSISVFLSRRENDRLKVGIR